VDVGGDVRVFGAPPKGSVWELTVPSPFAAGVALLSLRINEGAVCTHGDRPSESGGDLSDPIIDPRTGKLGLMSRASTAVASDAMNASAWATALYVQGPVGIGLLPAGVDGLVVAGKGEDSKIWATPAVAEATSDPSMRRTLQILGRPEPPSPRP
jgi:thiamine biosynthesis lipoprotein ApbE